MTNIQHLEYSKDERAFAGNVEDWQLGLYTLTIFNHFGGQTLFKGTLSLENDEDNPLVVHAEVTETDANAPVALGRLQRANREVNPYAVLARGDTARTHEGLHINTVLRSALLGLHAQTQNNQDKDGQIVQTYSTVDNIGSIRASLFARALRSNLPYSNQIHILPSLNRKTPDTVRITTNLQTPSTDEEQEAVFANYRQRQVMTAPRVTNLRRTHI